MTVTARMPALALAAGLLAGPGPLSRPIAYLGTQPATAPAPAPADPLARALTAASGLNFSGQVVVDWVDGAGRHRSTLGVTVEGGVVDLDGQRKVVADGDGRLVQGQQGWTLLWPTGDVSGSVPLYADKYTVVSEPGPNVAGRPTTEVVLSVAGHLRERVSVDTATGLPLQRAVYNPDGTFVRLVSFSSFTVTGSPSGSARASAPRAAHRSVPRPVATAVPAPYAAPLDLAAGYQRIGVFRSADGLEVLYSDGIDSLSVFEQPGALGSEPASRVTATVGRAPAAVWAWPGGQVATWQNGPAVFTVVGDGPLSDLLAAAGSLPPARSISLSQRLRHACRRLVSDLVGT